MYDDDQSWRQIQMGMLKDTFKSELKGGIRKRCTASKVRQYINNLFEFKIHVQHSSRFFIISTQIVYSIAAFHISLKELLGNCFLKNHTNLNLNYCGFFQTF